MYNKGDEFQRVYRVVKDMLKKEKEEKRCEKERNKWYVRMEYKSCC